MKINIKYLRKTIIYIFTVIIMATAALYIDAIKYQLFLQYTVFLALGFFASNSLEHISNAMKYLKEIKTSKKPKKLETPEIPGVIK